MSKYSGTKTEKNLMEAFAGESQARNKYTYFASVARKEGYEQIAAIFEEAAYNEKEHAKLWFKELEGIGDTATNLAHAAEGEHEEHTAMYPRMAKEAYLKLLKNLKEDLVFKTEDGQMMWICRNCGHIHIGAKAPELCPVCKHPKAFFERRPLNY